MTDEEFLKSDLVRGPSPNPHFELGYLRAVLARAVEDNTPISPADALKILEQARSAATPEYLKKADE